MEEDISECGKTMILMDKVCIHGQMVECTKVNTKMIKKMGMEFIGGLMEEYMKDGGIKVNNVD